MNFFQAQDNARRKTVHLALMFGAAVLTLVILTNVLIAMMWGWGGTQVGLSFSEQIATIPPDSWLWISIGVVGVVGTASLYRYLSLRGGGRSIAEALGGSLISQTTTNSQQRQLLNIVEEMAIAGGVSVPPVYLIPESSINAFAAGFSADDAVIGINQGTLDLLNRDELQGVVAHEFSHIINGDTNINLRLIAILHGILFIGIIGYGLMRVGGFGRKNGAPMIMIGLGLVVIGYGGVFFGNLIKAAVSRQREYLADASAVQFTRNPSGIADALKKIGGFPAGSTMESSHAEEASHMFFGAALPRFASNLFATHPPLPERIKAIEPRWNGQFPNVVSNADHSDHNQAAGGHHELASGFATASSSASTDIIDQVGSSSLETARELIADNPADLRTAAHDPFEARALVYCMLLDEQNDVVNAQLAYLQANAEPGVVPHLDRLRPQVNAADALHRLTLFEMAVPALKELSDAQFQRFKKNTAKLITADGHVNIFEWVLHRLLTKELAGHFERPTLPHGNISDIDKVAEEAGLLLSILASASSDNVTIQLEAYAQGLATLGTKKDLPFVKQEHFDYSRMNNALSRLRQLRPLAKPALIKACCAIVLADGHADATERALLKGVAATLNCPLPPNLH